MTSLNQSGNILIQDIWKW